MRGNKLAIIWWWFSLFKVYLHSYADIYLYRGSLGLDVPQRLNYSLRLEDQTPSSLESQFILNFQGCYQWVINFKFSFSRRHLFAVRWIDILVFCFSRGSVSFHFSYEFLRQFHDIIMGFAEGRFFYWEVNTLNRVWSSKLRSLSYHINMNAQRAVCAKDFK